MIPCCRASVKASSAQMGGLLFILLHCVRTRLRAGVAALSWMTVAQSALRFMVCQALGAMQPPCGELQPSPAVLPLHSCFLPLCLAVMPPRSVIVILVF